MLWQDKRSNKSHSMSGQPHEHWQLTPLQIEGYDDSVQSVVFIAQHSNTAAVRLCLRLFSEVENGYTKRLGNRPYLKAHCRSFKSKAI